VNSKQEPDNYYALLGVHPSASPIEIRRAYRDSSKKYHPDTTTLPTATAKAKFQALNEAYAVVSNPDRRLTYDSLLERLRQRQVGYSRVLLVQPQEHFQSFKPRVDKYRSSAYLDPTDRPLSGGELFALLMLVATFLGCLVLAIVVGIVRGEITWG
jgi:curved DNA-binding protein CbpA